MKLSQVIAASFSLVAPLIAGEQSGHAEADLFADSSTYKSGEPVTVGIRLKIEPGWHSYWVNPGLGGMPLKATWTLPEGWKAGELQHPKPKRFMTGDLPGFGYEGEAIYLAEITPPADAKGDAELAVKLAWLTCNDSSCVPGNAELELQLPEGDGSAGSNAALISAASEKIPVVLDGFDLTVEPEGESLLLKIKAPEEFDGTDVAIYPATADVIDPMDKPILKEKDGFWVAMVKKNEYAEETVTLLDLVLVGGNLPHAGSVSWKAGQ